MKPVVDLRRCFASKDVCMAIKECPFGAISYVDVDEPIMDKTLECNCDEREKLGLKPMSEEGYSAGCGCASGCGAENEDPLYGCGGTPYGRIIIDYDKCTRCGICAKECCGTAIGMYPEHYNVDAEPVKATKSDSETDMKDMFKIFKDMSMESMMEMCSKMMTMSVTDTENSEKNEEKQPCCSKEEKCC